jgi:hypothetical protein
LDDRNLSRAVASQQGSGCATLNILPVGGCGFTQAARSLTETIGQMITPAQSEQGCFLKERFCDDWEQYEREIT